MVNILLIRLRSIGDVIQTTPAVRALRRRLPEARISYLVETDAAPVVATNRCIDRVIEVRRTRGIERIGDDWRLAAGLRRERFDAVVDFHGGPRASWLAWASGAPTRIGFAVSGRGWMYTRRLRRPRTLRPRHSVQNQWDLLPLLDPAIAPSPDPERDPVEMPEDPAAAASIAGLLPRLGVGAHTPLIVLHVSAANPFRRWPQEAFVELTVRLATTDAARRLLVIAGPSERHASDRIIEAARARLGTKAEAVLPCRDVTLAELRALIARAALFVGGDSGPLNIAATTAVPIVGIYGPTLPVRAAPWRSATLVSEAAEYGALPCRPCHQQRCAPGDFRCLTRLTPESVAAAAERALARAARQNG